MNLYDTITYMRQQIKSSILNKKKNTCVSFFVFLKMIVADEGFATFITFIALVLVMNTKVKPGKQQTKYSNGTGNK